ncbi:GAF domain-containing protein [Desulfosediminicola sp.]|uniref:GAF domain-containing protein n=1 Tax=Desulfosediminicola sp. TaxID=2886825 RepID=UPI003AF1FA89
MIDKELQKKLLSIPAIATYIGTAIGIWGIVKDKQNLTIITLLVLVSILLGYLYQVYGKYKYFKRYKIIDSEFHRLSHRTRDMVTLMRCASEKQEVMSFTEAATRNALTVASNTFKTITGFDCTASLMIKQNNNRLKTTWYCHNSDPQRESQESTYLELNDGVAGEAVSTGCVIVWNNGDTKFKATREDYGKYYSSGISIPFKSGLEYMGVVNVDSKEIKIFDSKQHQEIGANIADTIGIIFNTQSMWEELNDKR